jgi:hypothetical protein
MKITYDGHDLKAQVVTIEMDTEEDAKSVFDGLHNVPQVEQTLTLNVYYWQLLWLASMIERQNPKKAKWIRRLAEPHNPLRLVGLLK